MKQLTSEEKKNILEKSNRLKETSIKLKKDFIGIDDIIDDVINLVEPWYLFPESQMRPTIINLWGMTGVGKSSLVIKLFEYLNIKNILKIDTGEWVSDSSQQLNYKLTSQLRKMKDTIPVFIFDEFQLGRTKNEIGDSIDRVNLRVIWDLLDTGKFSMMDDNWEVSVVYKLANKCRYLLDQGVVVKNGSIIEGKDIWSKIFSHDDDDMPNGDNENKTPYVKDPFIRFEKLWSIYKLTEPKYMSENHLADDLSKMDGPQIVKFLEDVVQNSMKPLIYDFSDSIIFVIGNLDKAYQISDEMDPDIDADSLYEHTKKINISDIKYCLTDLYKPEQISRLGNNHIIYKSFNTQNYKDIIELELNRTIKKVEDKFQIKIIFTDKIHDILYKEGVFPTQGARPVFSTIFSMIESYISRIIVDIINSGIDVSKIRWDFKNNNHIIKAGSKTFKYPVKTKINSLRESKNDDRQSLVGIHEAGHVITSVYALNICPKMVVSKSANAGDGGFTHIDGPDWKTFKYLLNDIVCLVGGYVAEKMIFGEDNVTVGSYSDLEKTTRTALKIVKEYGMNGVPIQYCYPNCKLYPDMNAVDIKNDDLDKKAVDIVEKCVNTAEKILNDNKELLLMMGQHLTNNSKMYADEIKEMVAKWGKYKAEYKTKDNYYDFKNIMEEKINLLNKSKVNIEQPFGIEMLNKKNKK